VFEIQHHHSFSCFNQNFNQENFIRDARGRRRLSASPNYQQRTSLWLTMLPPRKKRAV